MKMSFLMVALLAPFIFPTVVAGAGQVRDARVCLRNADALGPAQSQAASTGGAEEARIDSGYVEVDGGKLFYERMGNGETIVLIHDGLVHREIWDGQFPVYAKNYDVVRYDRRGYGKSPVPAARYSNVDDLYRLFEQLKIKKAILMGMSAGGGLVIDFALEHPDRVTALVLVGAVVSGFDYTNHVLTRGGRLRQQDRASTEAAIEYWAFKDPYETAPASTAAKEKVKALLLANPQNLDDRKGALRTPPKRPALPNLDEIKAPVLIVAGEYDIPDVHAHAGAIDAGTPNSRRIIIADAGHLVPMEQPEAFNTSVLQFLQEETFFTTINIEGVAAATKKFTDARGGNPKAFVFSENRMNLFAYEYLQTGRIADAIELFKLNVLAYPDSWNVYDSLAEAYMMSGDKARAIENYEKSIELNPQNQNGKDKLKDLGVQAQ
jgi:3-oxoadipate enol-lactonase